MLDIPNEDTMEPVDCSNIEHTAKVLGAHEPIEALDFSMINTFQTCRRKFYYNYVLNKVLKKEARPLTFGSAIHLGLDEWYKSRDINKAIELFKGAYEEDLEEDNKRTHAMGEWVLKNYDAQYRDQPHELVAGEMPFDLRVNGHRFIGRIDKVVKWADAYWVMDHKTTSSLGAQYGKGITPNAQFTGYVWAARQMGYNCVGIIVDAVLVAKGLLSASSRGRLTPLARFDTYRSEAQLKEWEAGFGQYTHEIDGAVATDNFPLDGAFNGACTYYGECPYRRLCVEDEDIRPRILEMDYKTEKWDPREVK